MSAGAADMDARPERPLRLLVICPSWVGDVVMATPALGMLRKELPGAFIGGLVRPGLEELLDGAGLFDELHVDRARGVMGPKLVAGRLRPRRYDTALLLTNSFSTALIARLAFIPRRVGYDRDGRVLLLTQRLVPQKRPGGGFAAVSAVEYYVRAARAITGNSAQPGPMTLGITEAQRRATDELLARAGVQPGAMYAVLNPGGNDPLKRWPAERFADVGRRLASEHGLQVLVSGSPGERELCESIAAGAGASAVALPALGLTIGALKGVVAGASVMLTNDTGPRHIAAAFDVPTVTLFGPTDPRWTTLPPGRSQRVDLWAGEGAGLPEGAVADEYPEQCRMDRLTVEQVGRAVDEVLGAGAGRAGGGSDAS